MINADTLAGRALLELVDELAVDVGRLRRRFAANPAWTGAYMADRLASNVEILAGIVHPSAAELVASVYPDDAETIDAAIDHVDQRARRLRRLLDTGRRR